MARLTEERTCANPECNKKWTFVVSKFVGKHKVKRVGGYGRKYCEKCMLEGHNGTRRDHGRFDR
jgi:hypothetical protein